MVNLIEFGVFIALLFAAVPLLGHYLAMIYRDEPHKPLPLLGWLEKFIYRFGGIQPEKEMKWGEYAKAMLWFNFFGLIFLFLLQLFQGWLPLNPQNFPGVELVFSTQYRHQLCHQH